MVCVDGVAIAWNHRRVRDALDPAAEAKRRRQWMVAWSLPGFVALGVFTLLAAVASAGVSRADAWEPLALAVALIGVASWALGPFCTLVALWLLCRDPWRRQRPRGERNAAAARLPQRRPPHVALVYLELLGAPL
jgi:hypothetical protein